MSAAIAPPISERLKDAALVSARQYLEEHRRTGAAVRELAAAGRLLVHLSRQPLVLRLEQDRILAEAEYASVGLTRQNKSVIFPNHAEAYCVRPDIVVHKRGDDGPNCLALEIKLGSWTRKPRGVSSHDCDKLKALTDPSQYNYSVGLWFALPINSTGRGHYVEFLGGQMRGGVLEIP